MFRFCLELQALCSLLGPFGVKQLNQILITRVGRLVKDLKTIAMANPRLAEIAKCIHDPSATAEILKSLKGKL